MARVIAIRVSLGVGKKRIKLSERSFLGFGGNENENVKEYGRFP